MFDSWLGLCADFSAYKFKPSPPPKIKLHECEKILGELSESVIKVLEEPVSLNLWRDTD